MPFVLLFLAVAMISIGMRGHAADASKLLASEFTGSNSFVQWFLAIMILGLIGYWKPAKPVADGMILLVIFSILLVPSHKNFIQALEDAFKNTKPTPPAKVTNDQTTQIISTAPASAPSFDPFAQGGSAHV